MFGGFKQLDANFTPAPNQFFDVVLGEEDCVVKVVGFLIRETLGWQDCVTRARRVEAGLPLSAFMARGMARNSARKGIDLAIERGYIVKTEGETPRSPARYAIRWEDTAAQREAIRRERLANGDPAPLPAGGQILTRSESDPLRGSKFDPLPIYSDSGKKKKKEIPRVLTLNVGEGFDSLASGGPTDHVHSGVFSPSAGVFSPSAGVFSPSAGVFSAALEAEAIKIAAELHDQGSERRHRQLLSVCETHGLSRLVTEALEATRGRVGKGGQWGAVEKPGAYYQSVLIKLLEDHQIFVPKTGEDDASEVRRLALASLDEG